MTLRHGCSRFGVVLMLVAVGVLAFSASAFANEVVDGCEIVEHPTKTTHTKCAGDDLEDAKLNGAELAFADLKGANLNEAELEGAHLEEAELQGAELRATDLEDADLAGAKLKEAFLVGAHLTGADLEDAHLEEVIADLADLAGANLKGANLTHEADLYGADLVGAELAGASLSEANLSGADLAGDDLEDLDLMFVSLGEADLAGANLKGANLNRTELVEADLEGADLEGDDLEADALEGADLEYADLKGANLNEAELEGGYLGGADLTGANLNYYGHPDLTPRTPEATIASPASGHTYNLGEEAKTKFACKDYPGLATCEDSNHVLAPAGASTAGQLDTSEAGEHEYTVTATSKHGLTGTATITYTVAQATPTVHSIPSGSIGVGGRETDGVVVEGIPAGGSPTGSVTFYVCSKGTGPCSSGGSLVGSPVPLLEGANDDSMATSEGFTPSEGAGTYCLRAEYSGDANYNAASDTSADECFTVAAPPTAEIKAPFSGGAYKQGEVIRTKFSCSEGEGGTELASCKDEDGVPSSEEGTLETTMLGSHTYTVSAKSKDGLEGSAKIEYSVIPAPPACKTAEGLGTYKKRFEAGRLTVRDKLSTNTSEAESLLVSTESGAVHFGLKKLTSASCGVVEGGLAFSGEGMARQYKKTGYTVHFSISVIKGKTYFSSTLTKGSEKIHEAVGEPLSKSNEVIH
jgi:uncharacterized protein YjbI with pentapeptide repeats